VNFSLGGTTLGNYHLKFIFHSWLADVLYIYPNKGKKNNFDSNIDNIVAMKKDGPEQSKNPMDMINNQVLKDQNVTRLQQFHDDTQKIYNKWQK
jgi:hypothetical protein